MIDDQSKTQNVWAPYNLALTEYVQTYIHITRNISTMFTVTGVCLIYIY